MRNISARESLLSGMLLIGLFLALAIPKWISANEKNAAALTTGTAHLETISQNLREIEAAKEQWMFQYHKSLNDPVHFTDLTLFLKGNVSPAPVAGEQYIVVGTGYLAEAQLPEGVTLNGRTGPFTITSF